MTPVSTPPASALRANLALDLRSLALLRAGLSAFLLGDALCRLFSAGLLYSDGGLLPRDLAITAPDPGSFSLLLANGSAAFAVLVVALQALSAAALLVGWRTRTAGALLWLLCASVLARHPAVATAADTLALVLLSLGLLVPWQARWSLDAAQLTERGDTACASWPARVLRVQAAALPVLLAMHGGGNGVRTLLASPLAHPPGRWLVEWPSVLAVLSPAVSLTAALVLLLALLPHARAQRAALAVYGVLLALALVLAPLGPLLWLGLLGALLLLDGQSWNRLAGPSPVPLRLYHDHQDLGAQRRAMLLREALCLPNTRVQAAQDSARVVQLFGQHTRLVLIDGDDRAHADAQAVTVLLRRSPLLRPLRPLLGAPAAARAARALLAAMPARPDAAPLADLRPTIAQPTAGTSLGLTLGALLAITQLAGAGVFPSTLAGPARALLTPIALGTSWIERLPPATPGRNWMVVVGETADGREVDALSDSLGPPVFEAHAFDLLPGERGRRYVAALAADGASHGRAGLARYVCARHASLHGLRLVRVVQAAGSTQTEQQVVWRHECRRP